jgi:hypothetical protein
MARMTTARKLLLGLLGGASSGITYLFRDEFTTAESAPMASPRTAEPGTATITDTTNQLSVSGGELLFAGTAVSNGSPRYVGPALSRVAGRTVIWGWREISAGSNRTNNAFCLGWHTADAATSFAAHGIFNGALGNMGALSASGYICRSTFVWARDTDYDFAFVLRGTGAFIFGKGGTYTNWTLLAVDPLVNTATMYPYRHYGAASIEKDATRYVRVRDVGGSFATDDGIATLAVASPADATEYTGDADGIIHMTVTAPGSLDGSATTRCGFYYRADADLSPAWHAYFDGLGAFNVDSIASDGTRTNRITAAGVIAGGATRTIGIVTNGTKHNAFTLSASTWTTRGSEVDLSLNDTVTTIEPSIPAGWTAANLKSFPRTSAAYAALDVT